MSKGKLQEAIKVMQAFADGKEIQYYQEECSPRWQSTLFPVWNWQEVNYRIKPEPLVIYAAMRDTKDAIYIASRNVLAVQDSVASSNYTDGKVRKFVEVIED